ncbi:glycosyltransferase [Sulfurospirillum cavolei]|uniref:glycosyltransferase n=1 Tax=Sulfurospirillum cavolei TaxID=366522 RepID=UPI000693C7FC|nr:glycosyltransferase [Sulfurospirillum cavolei]
MNLLNMPKGKKNSYSKIKKLYSLFKFAKNNPYFVGKFFQEIKINGLRSAIRKTKSKIYILDPIAYSPKLILQTDRTSILVFPAFDNPEVSIIIPVYNNFDYTYDCLQSIKENTQNISYEIIIGDDNSSDLTTQLYKFAENITILRDGINRGFLRNCNNAAGHAKGKYVLFLNNDTQVQSNWLSSLVDLIESDETIGMVGSKLVYPDGRLQEAGGIIWNDATGWNYGRLDDPMKPEYNYVKEVDYISGASIMIRKSLWLEIGGFDERYVPAYYEDSDLAFEVRKHGYKVVYQPKSVVVHFEGISNGTDVGSGIKQYQVINHEKFVNKWKDVLEKEHFPNAENVFLARDRSKGKPRVLFVDHYLPHYDQDAGSKAAFQYLKILASSPMQVHFIGDNFWHYPDSPYLEGLIQMGIEVLYGNWYAQNWQSWIQDNGQYLDYVILSRPHISIKYIDKIKEHSNAKIIYFGHDLHFLREEREYRLKKDKKILTSSEYWKDIEINLMKKSDVSYFFSDVEKNVIEQTDKHINVDIVPLFIYEEFKEKNYIAQNRKNIMFVGGFAHNPNIDAVQWFVSEIWPIVSEKIQDIKFYIIGSKPPKEIQQLADERIIVTGFISDTELSQYYDTFRLVVAPLRYGAGVKGKIVEALYNAMPIVTTSIGAEGINNANNIMKIVDESEAFATEVINFYNDLPLLDDFSQKSLENCKDNFSVLYAKKQMSHIISEFKGAL